MAPKSLELKVISCKDIKAFNFFQKLSIYTSVSLLVQPPHTKNSSSQKYQQQKTPVDRQGDGNPEWKHQLQFDLQPFSSSLDSLFIEFELLCEGLMFDKSIAHVLVPMKELVDGSKGGAVRFMSYQAVTADGQLNGVLEFSYKVFDDMPATNYSPQMPDVIYTPESNQFYYPLQDQGHGVYPPPLPPQPPSVYPPPSAVSSFGYPPPSAVSPFGYPPPPPALSQTVYPPPPMPYGQGSGEFCSQGCSYPADDQYRPYHYDDSWQRDVQPWNVSQMRPGQILNLQSSRVVEEVGIIMGV